MLVMYTLGEKSYKFLSNNCIIKNKDEIVDIIGLPFYEFINDKYPDDVIGILKFIIKNNYISFNSFKNIIISEVNPNNYKIFDSRTLTFRHNKEDADYCRGKSFRNTKRPDHSAKLKGKPNIKNRKSNWSKDRLKYSLEMNSIEWRRKILLNMGLNVSILNHNDIEKAFNEYSKKRVQSTKYKKSKIANFMENSLYENLYDKSELIKLYESDVNLAFSFINSVISTYHTKLSTNNMGGNYFKRELFNPNKLSKCKNINDFKTRSSYESTFIREFILKNIDNIEYWSFELESYKINNRLYTPDFIVCIDNIEYIIELKGYIRDENDFDNIILKNLFFNKNQNYRYLESPNITIEDLIKNKNMQIFKKTHKQEFNEPIAGNSIGLTRNQIIENLEPESTFIYNGVFLYTVDKHWNNIEFYLCINDKCISELTVDVKSLQIIHRESNSSRFSNKLEENLAINLNEIKKIKDNYVNN